MQPEKSGDYIWTATALAFLGYDAWALATEHETASHAMRRYTESPARKFLFVGIVGGLALHFLSEQYDPFRLTIERMRRETP